MNLPFSARFKIWCIKAECRVKLTLLFLLKAMYLLLCFAVGAGLVLLFHWLCGGEFKRSFWFAVTCFASVSVGMSFVTAALDRSSERKAARTKKIEHSTEYL